MTTAIKLQDGWIICGKCGHKLARSIGSIGEHGAEIIQFKCSTCKELNVYQCSDTKAPNLIEYMDNSEPPELITNRRWLESLSDEDLAKIIEAHFSDDCNFCVYKDNPIECHDNSCNAGHIKWLQAEHKGE